MGVDELEISTRVKDDNAVDQMSSFTIQRDYCEIGEPVRVKEGITNIPDSNVFDEYVEGTVKKYVVQEKIRDEVEFNNVETNELKQLTEDASDVIQNALTEDSEDNEIKIWDGNPMVDNSEHMMTENQRKKNMIERLKNEGLLDDDSPQERYMTGETIVDALITFQIYTTF